MTWVKLDDAFYRNPKVMGLSDGAFRTYVNSICFSADNLTDGLITPQVARTFRWERKAIELIEAGMWEEQGVGWYIHDFLDYNPTREQVMAERAKTAERVNRFRNGGRNAVTNAVGTDAPVPDPVPSAIPTESSIRKRARAEVHPFTDEDRVKLRERYSASATVDEINEQIELALAHKALKNTTRQDLYVNNWLRRAFEGRNGRNTNGGARSQAGGRNGGYGGAGRVSGAAQMGGARPAFDLPPQFERSDFAGTTSGDPGAQQA